VYPTKCSYRFDLVRVITELQTAAGMLLRIESI
jgi:hypothetical protein